MLHKQSVLNSAGCPVSTVRTHWKNEVEISAVPVEERHVQESVLLRLLHEFKGRDKISCEDLCSFIVVYVEISKQQQ